LLVAEFGDAVVYGSTTAVFALFNGGLAGWDINSRSAVTIQSVASGSGNLGLYRCANVNQAGGPTKNEGGIVFGEITSPGDAESNGSNNYNLVWGDPRKNASSITLPLDWYVGSNMYVAVNSYFAKFDPGFSDIFGGGAVAFGLWQTLKGLGKITGQAVLRGAGGPAGVASLVVSITSCFYYDTSYVILPGSGPMPISPVPTPPS
jgi:hypothetical protein